MLRLQAVAFPLFFSFFHLVSLFCSLCLGKPRVYHLWSESQDKSFWLMGCSFWIICLRFNERRLGYISVMCCFVWSSFWYFIYFCCLRRWWLNSVFYSFLFFIVYLICAVHSIVCVRVCALASSLQILNCCVHSQWIEYWVCHWEYLSSIDWIE